MTENFKVPFNKFKKTVDETNMQLKISGKRFNDPMTKMNSGGIKSNLVINPLDKFKFS